MKNLSDDIQTALGGEIVLTIFACLAATFIGDGTYEKGIFGGAWAVLGIFIGRRTMRDE
ncbi:hypothetical protein N9Y51_03760 [Alphaproteobacteria bacterium]|nr:hypothetical protein [Alphaproteobacteria bacterium]